MGCSLQELLLDPATVSYRAAVDLIDLLCEKQAEVLPRLESQRGPAWVRVMRELGAGQGRYFAQLARSCIGNSWKARTSWSVRVEPKRRAPDRRYASTSWISRIPPAAFT